MLTENDIINAVCKYLESQGYSEISSKNTKQQGIDIEATSPDGSKFYIEAKGETSSNPDSNRFGKPFNNNQALDHVAKATYTALKMNESKESNAKIGIALPLEINHQKLINPIKHTLKDLEISIFWVDKNLKVTSEWLFMQK